MDNNFDYSFNWKVSIVYLMSLIDFSFLILYKAFRELWSSKANDLRFGSFVFRLGLRPQFDSLFVFLLSKGLLIENMFQDLEL